MLGSGFLIGCITLAAGVWASAAGADQWQLLLQAACAVVISLSIFLMVLRFTDSDADEGAANGSHPADTTLLAIATYTPRR
ncbi:MAG TPA: hypothetical protein VGH81_13720 [Rudaea sp.]|jgi:hypothetical protein